MNCRTIGLFLGMIFTTGVSLAVDETLYWKGSEGGLLESSSWTNAAGTVSQPGWNNTLVIPVGGSFTNLNGGKFGPKIFRITTPDPVTIEGAGFHFEDGGSPTATAARRPRPSASTRRRTARTSAVPASFDFRRVRC